MVFFLHLKLVIHLFSLMSFSQKPRDVLSVPISNQYDTLGYERVSLALLTSELYAKFDFF